MCEFLTIVILFLYEVNLCVSACYDDDDDDDEKKKNAGIDANTNEIIPTLFIGPS